MTPVPVQFPPSQNNQMITKSGVSEGEEEEEESLPILGETAEKDKEGEAKREGEMWTEKEGREKRKAFR